jgi:predicted Fe-S protein YdhL (DUF1289 family)
MSTSERKHIGGISSHELTGPDKKLLKIKKVDRVDITVPSPCIDVCRYSAYDTLSSEGLFTFQASTEKLCVGCFRNKEELINWWAWDAPRKLQALIDIKRRKQNVKNR